MIFLFGFYIDQKVLVSNGDIGLTKAIPFGPGFHDTYLAGEDQLVFVFHEIGVSCKYIEAAAVAVAQLKIIQRFVLWAAVDEKSMAWLWCFHQYNISLDFFFRAVGRLDKKGIGKESRSVA